MPFNPCVGVEDDFVLLPEALSSGINSALSTRITNNKFDFRKKDEQQTALIATFRALVTEIHARMASGQRSLDLALNERRTLGEKEREATAVKETLEKKCQTLEDDITKLKEIAKKMRRAYDSTRSDLNQKESELTVTSSNRSVLESRLNELESTRMSNSERLREAEKELAAVRERLRTEEEAGVKLRAQVTEKDNELSRTMAMLGTAQSYHQSSATQLQEQVRELIDGKHKAELELRDARSELAGLKASLTSAQELVASASTDKSAVVHERDDAIKSLTVLQTQLEELRRQLGENAAALSAAQSELQTVSMNYAAEKQSKEYEAKQKDDAQERAVALHTEVMQVKQQLMDAITETNNLRQELSRAKEEFATQREALTTSHAAEKVAWSEKAAANEEKWQAERTALDERFNSERCRLESEGKVLQVRPSSNFYYSSIFKCINILIPQKCQISCFLSFVLV